MIQIIKKFLLIRYASLVAVLCSGLGSLLLFIIGAKKTYYAFRAFFYFNALEYPKEQLNLGPDGIAVVYLVRALDSFLIALVLLIFGMGIFRLFLYSQPTHGSLPKWSNFENIGQLQKIIEEVIIAILFVYFLDLVLISLQTLSWELLILPVSILLLSGSLILVKISKSK